MRRAAWVAWAAAVAFVGAALWLADRSGAISVACFEVAGLLMGAVFALDAPRYAKGGWTRPAPAPDRLQRVAAPFHAPSSTVCGVHVVVRVHEISTSCSQKAERTGPLAFTHSHRGEFGPR